MNASIMLIDTTIHYTVVCTIKKKQCLMLCGEGGGGGGEGRCGWKRNPTVLGYSVNLYNCLVF